MGSMNNRPSPCIREGDKGEIPNTGNKKSHVHMPPLTTVFYFLPFEFFFFWYLAQILTYFSKYLQVYYLIMYCMYQCALGCESQISYFSESEVIFTFQILRWLLSKMCLWFTVHLPLLTFWLHTLYTQGCFINVLLFVKK